MSALLRITDSSQTSRHVRFVPILLQKSAAIDGAVGHFVDERPALIRRP